MLRKIHWEIVIFGGLLVLGSGLVFFMGSTDPTSVLIYLLLLAIFGGVTILSQRLKAVEQSLQALPEEPAPGYTEQTRILGQALENQARTIQGVFEAHIDADLQARKDQITTIQQAEREQTQILVRALNDHTRALQDVVAELRARDRLPYLKLELLAAGETPGAYRSEAVEQLEFHMQRINRLGTRCALRLCNFGELAATRLYLSVEFIAKDKKSTPLQVEYQAARQNFQRAASFLRHPIDQPPGWTFRFPPELVIYPVRDDCPIIAELDLSMPVSDFSSAYELRYRVYAVEGNQRPDADPEGWQSLALQFII